MKCYLLMPQSYWIVGVMSSERDHLQSSAITSSTYIGKIPKPWLEVAFSTTLGNVLDKVARGLGGNFHENWELPSSLMAASTSMHYNNLFAGLENLSLKV